jgi:sulfotransferase family protein
MIHGYLRRRRVQYAAPPGPPAPFVVGVGRSGTTLLRMMLDAHPVLAIPPETHFVHDLLLAGEKIRMTPERLVNTVVHDRHRRWGDFGIDEREYLERVREIPRLNASDAVRAFFEIYAEHAGKPRWGDKTPDYVKRVRRINRALPEAHFLHVIRDGRDVALSHNRRIARRGEKSRPPVPAGEMARRWRKRIEKARYDAKDVRHYTEIRYEDLVTDTETTLRRVCEFIELDYDSTMLDYHRRAEERLQEMARDLPAGQGRPHRPGEERLQAHALLKEPPQEERVGRWREEMSAADVAAFEEIAGDLLAELDYETASRAGPLAS